MTSTSRISMAEAASPLGMGRATLYRKSAQYGLKVPRGRQRTA